MKSFVTDEVYEVTGYNDYSSWLVGYFTNPLDAQKAAKGKGTWGADGLVSNPKKITVLVYESYDEYLDGAKDKLRKQALAKLSAEERDALGFK